MEPTQPAGWIRRRRGGSTSSSYVQSAT